MKILFVMRNQAYMRNYESTLKTLAQRGHLVKIIFNVSKDNDRLVEKLAAENSRITYTYDAIPKRRDEWKSFIKLIRASKDYLRYLSPQYRQAKKLRKRVEKHLGLLIFLQGLRWLPKSLGLQPMKRLIEIIEWIIPADETINEFLVQEDPDLMLITPLVDFDSVQTDYLKCAHYLGIKCGLCVHSWDNLTNKGTIHIEPDRVFIWNNIQAKEAIELHHISPSKIVVTGAQCYDKWFAREVSTSQTEFAQKVGLGVCKRYLLYLCSSSFIAPQEVSFVQELLQTMRMADHSQVKELGLLVRPHPQNAQQWDKVDFSRWNNVVIWPRDGQNPVNEESRTNFYDSIYHSVAVVGVNTSAMIESGILGKLVYSILDPRFKETQEGTLHFHYLAKGGLLRLSHSIEEYIQQLGLMLEEDFKQEQQRIKQFIHEFVRPYGLDIPGTPILVNEIESMQNLKPPYIPSLPAWGVFLKSILHPLAIVIDKFADCYKRIKGLFNRFILKR
jgi:hypothetical protein